LSKAYDLGNLGAYLRITTMNFDEYCNAITLIDQELQRIADVTAGQALFEVANRDNPAFVQLMFRHQHLVQLSNELTERMAAATSQNTDC
jgi:hypothetical protein